MRFWAVIGRAIRLRCPRCGGSKLYEKGLRMAVACPGCGLRFEPEPGYYVGAMYLNFVATAILGLGTGLSLIGTIPERALVASLGAFAILFPLGFFRHSRSLWLALDLYITGKVKDPDPPSAPAA